MNKKYLVTGGCGFIGSNYIERLLKNKPDVEVFNVDALTYAGRLENTESFSENPRYQFQKMDIADGYVGEIFNKFKPDIVINFAAESHVDRSISSSYEFVRTNVLGTLALLDNASRVGVNGFIQIGTDEVYGDIPGSYCSREDDLLKPRSPYSASKASADLLALSYWTTHKLPVIVTRCCNNYGPRQFPEKLLPLFITNLIDNKKVPIYGDGEQIREWIHVDDHCAAIDHLIRYAGVGIVYNIGSGVEKTNLEMASTLFYWLNKNEQYIEYVEDRKGHDRRYAVDCSRLKSYTDEDYVWEPQYTFEEGIRQTVEWYAENVDWWRPLKDE